MQTHPQQTIKIFIRTQQKTKKSHSSPSIFSSGIGVDAPQHAVQMYSVPSCYTVTAQCSDFIFTDVCTSLLSGSKSLMIPSPRHCFEY